MRVTGTVDDYLALASIADRAIRQERGRVTLRVTIATSSTSISALGVARTNGPRASRTFRWSHRSQVRSPSGGPPGWRLSASGGAGQRHERTQAAGWLSWASMPVSATLGAIQERSGKRRQACPVYARRALPFRCDHVPVLAL